ncbi:MAG: hypothetical protein AABY18_07545 [Candidatus Thermoplasmatota archaeon]
MRALLVAAVVFVAALAGCSAKKESHDHLTYTCPNGQVISEEDYEGVLDNITVDFLKTKCPKGTGGSPGSSTTTTSQAPNKLPVLKIKVTDFAGNATNVTMLDGNLTFDATGSSDPDGAISAIAISVQDSNTTRTLPLYNSAKKTFTKAVFSFDRAGPVNVSVAMVDDRAGFNGSVFKVYVNHAQALGGGTLRGPVADTDLTDPCQGASGVLGAQGPLVHQQYFMAASIVVVPGATFIEAIPGTDTLVTICSPEHVAISDEKSKVAITSDNTEPLPMPDSGIKNYHLGFYSNGANVDTKAQVIVHYEPRVAAAA